MLTPYFLKQYGERRTGTNALRALLSANLRGVVVLMHVLGDKHSPPVNFDEIWRDAQASDDPAYAFVSRATFAAPALTTSADDRRQVNELRRCAVAIAEAHLDGRIGWIISVRHPHSWAVSLARFLGWSSRRLIPEERSDDLRAACLRFNENHRAWCALADAEPARTMFVRHEDLVRDAVTTVQQVASHFALSPSETYTPIDRVMEPALWDHTGMPARLLSYDRDYYAGGDHLSTLTPSLRRLITGTIDWDLLRRFGYEPIDA